MGKTSWQVKQKYARAHYSSVTAMLDKEYAAAFREKLKAEGIPYAQWLKDRIEEYLRGRG